jgi:pimeloyl-ACP methyl ester carboxylesterase
MAGVLTDSSISAQVRALPSTRCGALISIEAAAPCAHCDPPGPGKLGVAADWDRIGYSTDRPHHWNPAFMNLPLVAGGMALLASLAGLWLWTPDQDRVSLEARYAGPPSRFVDVAGVRLHVRDSGPRDAPAVVLLHGFGSSLHTWEDWARELERDHRVIRYDLPGAGLTGADPSGDYSDVRGMQVLLGLLDQLGVARTSLVGHSMGGRLAWRFAAAHPERVERLVLVSPDGFASPGFRYGEAPAVPLMFRMMKYVLPKAMLRPNLAAAYGDPSVMTDALLDRYYALMLAPGVRSAMITRMEQSVLPEPAPLLRQIQAPTLLLWGEKDAMIPIANAADYLAALPHATLVRLPGVGHVPHEEIPSASLEPVRAFLATPATAPAPS